ncbi:PDR/VanB family oxidoreductase [Streptomyces sp. DSM 3412]|uniref:PDR/VanB family oxidoreductase n=1 Tax=Streptomyces gottesmaniae TaxID=3075518 RepID=A0ABU2Z102_9ACTN|nr:PDR/VanB family oxidoreductase [Streptomyces sp. DSM 3412]MDT0570264.1 PDR/VanB family oxidoreductase [Streptomyces sp. DSM 3412]
MTGTPALRLTVTRMRYEADGVLSLTLADPAGTPLPEWTPGAHLDLRLPSGLTRQYSLCGDPANRHEYRVAVLLAEDSRGGSREIHATVQTGDSLDVAGPRNHFRLVDAPAYLFIAGGIGITPLLPMMRQAAAAGTPWSLLYGGRTRPSMAFLDEIGDLSGGKVSLAPQDEAGLPDIGAQLRDAPPEAAVYCCGPEGLLRAVRSLCAERPDQPTVHFERFAAADPAPAAATQETSAAFEVELRRSGIRVTVAPDTTVLDAVREVLPTAPFSCGEGVCGTCETTVLDGVPDHRDELLTPEEHESGTTMLICVSRCRGPRLVLDL